MLKLNLLPGSYLNRGGAKIAAIAVLVLWLLILAGLYFWGQQAAATAQASIKEGNDQQPTIQQVDALTNSTQAYNGQWQTIKPQTEFLKMIEKEPGQMAGVMRVIARATIAHIIIQKYSIRPGNPQIDLTAYALDFDSFNRWRLFLLQDPDFQGMPSISQWNPNGPTAAAGGRGGPAGGAAGGALPAGGGKFGGMGMGGGMGGMMGGAGGRSGGSSGYFIPTQFFPKYMPVNVSVQLQPDLVPVAPAWPPPDTSAGGAAAGTTGGMAGGMGGGYPTGGGGGMGGGYPTGGGGGMGGGYPTGGGGGTPAAGKASGGGGAAM